MYELREAYVYIVLIVKMKFCRTAKSLKIVIKSCGNICKPKETIKLANEELIEELSQCDDNFNEFMVAYKVEPKKTI